jgi:hypothetical protein
MCPKIKGRFVGAGLPKKVIGQKFEGGPLEQAFSTSVVSFKFIR